MAGKVDFCGIYSGKSEDKSRLFKIFYGSIKTAPLIEECPINFECELIQSIELGSHTLFIGQIMETHVSDHCFENNRIVTETVDPLIFVGPTRQYHRLGKTVAQAFHVGRKESS